MSVHLETPTQYLDDSRRIGPSQVHDPTTRPGLEIQPPSRGEDTPPRSRLDPVGPVASQGSDIPLRSPLQVQQRSVLEAMAMARPVITSDLAAGPHIVLAPPAVAEDRMTGLSFQSGDDGELAAALIRLLSAPEGTRLAMGRRGRERALAQFAAKDAATQMLTLYSELARSRT